jgi:hypothetical protein
MNDLVPVKPDLFYTFSQNNSGGAFEGPAEYVIVEAQSADEANSIAENNGLYFNGCEDGRDCDCCGDRWHEQWSDDEGDPSPMIYGKPVETALANSIWRRDALIVWKKGDPTYIKIEEDKE